MLRRGLNFDLYAPLLIVLSFRSVTLSLFQFLLHALRLANSEFLDLKIRLLEVTLQAHLDWERSVLVMH